jgi:hypothetical protein
MRLPGIVTSVVLFAACSRGGNADTASPLVPVSRSLSSSVSGPLTYCADVSPRIQAVISAIRVKKLQGLSHEVEGLAHEVGVIDDATLSGTNGQFALRTIALKLDQVRLALLSSNVTRLPRATSSLLAASTTTDHLFGC